MIYINSVELLSVMLHAKFQIHRPSGSGEEGRQPLGLKYFHKHKSSVHLLIPSKFSAIA